MSRIRWPVYVLFALFFLFPRVALAEGLTDSFVNGVRTFAGEDISEQVTPEVDFELSYEPVYVRETTREEGSEEETTMLGSIANTIEDGTTVPLSIGAETMAGGNALIRFFQYTFISGRSNGLLFVAAGICFMWWGIRKAIRMIFAGFRKGSASV